MMLLEGLVLLILSFFLEIQTEKTDSEIPKNFLLGISLCICRMSLQTLPKNKNKTIQKFFFDFIYCKLPELAGCFISFKEGFKIFLKLTKKKKKDLSCVSNCLRQPSERE